MILSQLAKSIGTQQSRQSLSHLFVAATTPSARLHTSSVAMFALSRASKNAAEPLPKTFSRQDSLPRLPVPALEDTFAKYIKSLEPILLQAEELGHLQPGETAAGELEKRKRWAAAALQPGTLVQRLQQRLYDVDRTTPDNWLDDRYWIVKAYHEWRVPLLINSNWWLMFRSEPDTPAAALEDVSIKHPEAGAGVPSEDMAVALGANTWPQLEWGIRRATWLTYRLALFKSRLDNEQIPPDASRTAAFCMHQYTRVFGVNRIPAIPHDYNTQGGQPNGNRHVTVLVRNNIYTMRIIGDDGNIVPLRDIERAFTEIVADARKADGKAVSVLTASNRDDWARAREDLLAVSPQNRASLDEVESSLFAVCLDSDVLPLPLDRAAVAHPATPEGVDAHARNCAGAGRGGLNRWFDKALNVVVESNGRSGIMGEHSPCDALIPDVVLNFAVAVTTPHPSEPLALDAPGTSPNPVSGPIFHKVAFDVDAKTEENIQRAFDEARAISGESDMGEMWFDEYGTDWIKKVAKQSPDAYVQQVLQLALSKVKGFQTPTYETASTRMFKHGRTDVIRSFSRESYEFVRAVREGRPDSEIYAKLTAATTAHNQQTRASSQGKGIDRHLTGLRLLYDAARDGAIPPTNSEAGFYAGAQLLFGDPLLGESQSWKLSTSGLSAGNLLAGTGFGSGFVDGFGVNYLTGSRLLKFGIESKHPAPLGKGELGQHPTNQFARAIVDSLRYMRQLCEAQAPQTTPEVSKL